MKVNLFLILLIIGILLIPLVFVHWLFLVSAIFMIISAFLFKAK